MLCDGESEPKLEEDEVVDYVYSVGSRHRLTPILRVDPVDFWSTLNSRRSRRTFGELSSAQLSTLLWNAARTKEVYEEASGFLWQHRAAPSAGGRHPVDILVHAPALGIPLFSLYDPLTHQLADLESEDSQIDRLISKVNCILPVQDGVLIWLMAQYNRTSSKYNNPSSLIWRDVGALLATLNLVAEAMGLNFCPLGTTAEHEILDLFPNSNVIVSAGGCLIGSSSK